MLTLITQSDCLKYSDAKFQKFEFKFARNKCTFVTEIAKIKEKLKTPNLVKYTPWFM